MRRDRRFLIMLVMVFSIVTQAVFSGENIAEAKEGKPTHGSSDTWITEDQLVTEVPKDYKVNQATQGEAKEGLYNTFFLKEDIQTISIEIDENNLNYMFQNAYAKPSVLAKKVTIGEESVEYVGLKTKGNYTLQHSYSDNPQSDRFSLTINFGKYVKKAEYGETQNFYGVDKISLNNFFFDKSMMKEYCALLLMKEMGLPTPQFGLCKLYINGQYYGVYSMIEALDSSIVEQYYRCDSKAVSDYLCKPSGTAFIYENLKRDWSPMWEQDDDTLKKVEKVLPTVQAWVKKLNQLSDGVDFQDEKIDVNSKDYLELLDQIIDTDEFLRYFAVHSFLCQLDDMFVTQQNFGLYVEEDGRALLIPWDYDLSFGTFSPVTAEATANFPLDQMFINGNGTNAAAFEIQQFYRDYPLFNVIYQNEELVKKYHTYMEDCAKIMALGGTTSFGAAYEPTMANKRIETLTESLTAAATEKTAARAKYMNGISQPRDLKNGLLSLSKIIAMRSVGVYSKVHNLTTHVSGKGCNLAQVGNGQDNWMVQTYGYITAINAVYGIFTDAMYDGASPVLTVKELAETDADYSTITDLAKYKGSGFFKIYEMKDSAASKRKSEYTLSIPLGSDYEKKNLTFYSYKDGQLTELTGSWSDGIFITQTEDIETIVIVEGNSADAKYSKRNVLPKVFSVGGFLIVFVIIIIIRKTIENKRNK